jgi:hypothetical protein
LGRVPFGRFERCPGCQRPLGGVHECVHKVKPRKRKLRYPTQMVYPNKFCSLDAGMPALNSTTSDAVFEPMQEKVNPDRSSIIYGG